MKTFTVPKGISDEDLRAAQAIKEHQDFKQNTNQSLQALSQGIVSLSIQHEKVLANSKSDRKALLIEFENLRESVLSSMHEMDQRLGDVETKLFELLDSFTDLREEVMQKFLTKQEFYDAYVKEVKHLDDLEKRVNQRDDYFNLRFAALGGQFKDQIEVVKKDLTPQVPEVDPIKKQLDERLNIFKIDFDGLVREIALLKRAVSYDQKKFENVYTLIERLKGEKA